MKATFALAVIVVAFLWANTGDYNDKAAAAAERAENVGKARPAPEPAPIYSRKCERKGMDILTKRADTGPWTIHCVPRRVLTVGA